VTVDHANLQSGQYERWAAHSSLLPLPAGINMLGGRAGGGIHAHDLTLLCQVRGQAHTGIYTHHPCWSATAVRCCCSCCCQVRHGSVAAGLRGGGGGRGRVYGAGGPGIRGPQRARRAFGPAVDHAGPVSARLSAPWEQIGQLLGGGAALDRLDQYWRDSARLGAAGSVWPGAEVQGVKRKVCSGGSLCCGHAAMGPACRRL
jgi:hypothetical protein